MKSFWHNLPQPFFALAPMEAVTDVVFRHVVSRAGAPDVYFTEFTNATGWAHAGNVAIGGRLVKTDDERPIVSQLWGNDPVAMEKMAIHCRELGFDGIDLNMGCPDKSAVKAGGGAGMIRTPDLGGQMIAAAQKSGLPISVKTRLGYSRVDEWRDWLGYLLSKDLAVLIVHLRTKSEMSKVPAHHELIPEILALRDALAPDTLIVINGDVADRAHGVDLAEQNPGLNGIMIGRGIFQNPYCFTSQATSQSHSAIVATGYLQPDKSQAPLGSQLSETSATRAPADGCSTGARREAVSENSTIKKATKTQKQNLLNLLRLHLDLYDKYAAQTGRPYETLQRFYKVYIRDFDGASALRDRLMHTRSTDEVREIIDNIQS